MNSALRQFVALVFAAVASTAGAQSTLILGPYQYDGSGNVTGVGMDAQYRYDAYGRLGTSQIYVNGNLHTQQFTYDRFGNITTIATDGTPMHLGVDSGTNRLTLNSQTAGIFGKHDDDGNMTSYIGNTTFESDELGMVRRAELEGHKKVYLYTVDDERIATIDLTLAGEEDDSLWTLRDLSGKVLREYRKTTASGEQWQWREDYVYRGGALLAAEVPGDTLHFHPDHLGTPRLITNALGAKVSEHTYAPFGIELTPAGTQRMKFTGHERDMPNLDQPTLGKALDYMHARYYTPGGGRFLSVDPVLDVKRALTNPQTWNRYAYVTNNPVNRIDPDGRVVRMFGNTDETRRDVFAVVMSALRPNDRKYVTMKDGIVAVDPKAQGGVALMKLKDLASADATVTVRLGETATGKKKPLPGPAPVETFNLQQRGGGGVTIPPGLSVSGNMEVHVDPRGSILYGSPAVAVMAHELMGHAWDNLFTKVGKDPEESAKMTEKRILLELGMKTYQ